MRNDKNQRQHIDKNLAEMLRTNVQQKQYYESDNPHIETGGAATRLWARTRRIMQGMTKNAGIDDDMHRLHREWLGELAGKKVLDLGCFAGNPLSLHLARTSASYLGLDLSELAVRKLNQSLVEEGLYGPETKALAGDFLSPTFNETHFDVVYARSVLHHFEYLDAALRLLHNKLVPGGIVVTWDAMETSLPVRVARTFYRPFQSDKNWEYPFTRATFRSFQEYFVLEHLQGILGRSKWGFLLAPLGTDHAVHLARRWHEHDLEHANKLGTDLWQCMQVVMKLRRAPTSKEATRRSRSLY